MASADNSNVFETPGVKNIGERYAAQGGTETHMPGVATPRGTFSAIEIFGTGWLVREGGMMADEIPQATRRSRPRRRRRSTARRRASSRTGWRIRSRIPTSWAKRSGRRRWGRVSLPWPSPVLLRLSTQPVANNASRTPQRRANRPPLPPPHPLPQPKRTTTRPMARRPRSWFPTLLLARW